MSLPKASVSGLPEPLIGEVAVSHDSKRNRSIIVEVLGMIFRSGILAMISAAIEAVTGLQEKRFSIAANVAYTCTPRGRYVPNLS